MLVSKLRLLLPVEKPAITIEGRTGYDAIEDVRDERGELSGCVVGGEVIPFVGV